MEGTTSEILETFLSNKVLDTGTPAVSEDLLSSPTCTQPSSQTEQSKSVVTFAASVEACVGAKQENAKLNTNSPMHDTKSAYSSSVGPFLFSQSCLFMLVCMILQFQYV
jgi:predicted phage gp36 major capsid-like protein